MDEWMNGWMDGWIDMNEGMKEWVFRNNEWTNVEQMND